MAEDNLEKFIRQNRDAFDDQVPSERLWRNISGQLPPVRKQNVWWKVAAVFFFFTTGIFLYQDYVAPAGSGEELAELEDYYFDQIEYKKSLVSNISHDAELIPGLEQDLQRLDAMYLVLKEEWQKKPSRQVLEALTLNLLVRLDLLNRQLEALNEEDKTERNI